MNRLFRIVFLVLQLIALIGCGGNSSDISPNVSVASAKYLYVANASDATVSGFAIAPTGALTSVGANIAAGLSSPTGIASGSAYKLYVGSSDSRNISTFGIDLKTGQLSGLTPLPQVVMNRPLYSYAGNLTTCGTHLLAFGEFFDQNPPPGTSFSGWGGTAFPLAPDGFIGSVSGLSGFGIAASAPFVS